MPLLFVRKPWCDYLRDGIKIYELRPDHPRYRWWREGTELSINGQFKMVIESKARFADILECVDAIGWAPCGFSSEEHALQLWQTLYPELPPVLAFRVSRMK